MAPCAIFLVEQAISGGEPADDAAGRNDEAVGRRATAALAAPGGASDSFQD